MTRIPAARPGPDTAAAAGPVRWTLLVPVFTGPFMALLDLSIVTVALPGMQASLHTSFAALQWVIDGYTLALSALLLTAGSLGDRYGRRRLYLAGIAVFTIGSAVCAASPAIGPLVAGRIIQGAGATSLIPGSLSILAQAFPDSGHRARMIGVWGGCGSLAVALGPVIGGILTQEVGWQAIFLLNLPIGVLAVFLGARSIPETADPDHAATDPAGQAASIAWLGALTFGLIQAGTRGWASPVTVIPLAMAVAGLAVFVAVEARAGHPMLPLSMFRVPVFAVANLASFALGFGAYSVFTFLSLYLQDVQGDTAVSAGLRFLPLCCAIAVTSVYAGKFTARTGPPLAMTVGYALTGVGLLTMVAFGPATSYLLIAVVFLLFGTGMGLSITPTTASVMSAAQRQRSGIASGTVNATRQAGTTVGIAALGSIIASQAVTRLTRAFASRRVPAPLAQKAATAAVTAHSSAAITGTGLTKAALAQLYGQAFTGGIHLAAVIAGAVTLLAAVLPLSQIRLNWKTWTG
jgi:MFS transporter, DHA2 family, methylenomycin A resistance protein